MIFKDEHHGEKARKGVGGLPGKASEVGRKGASVLKGAHSIVWGQREPEQLQSRVGTALVVGHL